MPWGACSKGNTNEKLSTRLHSSLNPPALVGGPSRDRTRLLHALRRSIGSPPSRSRRDILVFLQMTIPAPGTFEETLSESRDKDQDDLRYGAKWDWAQCAGGIWIFKSLPSHGFFLLISPQHSSVTTLCFYNARSLRLLDSCRLHSCRQGCCVPPPCAFHGLHRPGLSETQVE